MVDPRLLPAVSPAAADSTPVEPCIDGHGGVGVTTAGDMPAIARVSAAVKSDASMAYRAKTRLCATLSEERRDKGRHGDSCRIAAGSSDAEVAASADHHAKLPRAPLRQPSTGRRPPPA